MVPQNIINQFGSHNFEDAIRKYTALQCPHEIFSKNCTGCLNDQVLQKRILLKSQEQQYPFFYEGLAKTVEYCITEDLEDLTYAQFSEKLTDACQESLKLIETLTD